MKKNIHPKYYPNAKIVCVCGNTFEVGSTVEEVRVELCSNCHPFYTGKQKLVDTAKRVDKYYKKLEKKQEIPKTKKIRKGKQAKQVDLKASEESKNKK